MKTEQTAGRPSESRKPQIELQQRYGRIAISAVAAALNCSGRNCQASDDRDDAEPWTDGKSGTKAQKHN